MEWETLHKVVLAGFALAVIFGAIANRTNFCTMGAISDWVNMGSKGRFGAWILAMGIAIAGTQILELTGMVNLEESIYRSSTFGLLGYILGGLIFGIGMTLSGGCGQRTLVRVGSGNLKSLVVFLVLAISAYMTLRGLFGQFRLDYIDSRAIDLSARGLEEQGLASLFSHWFGWEATAGLKWGVAALVSLALILLALNIKALRQSGENLFAGISIGLIITAGWAITGILGVDDFDPTPLESMSFVAPSGNSLSYLMTYTGATINLWHSHCVRRHCWLVLIFVAQSNLSDRNVHRQAGYGESSARWPLHGIWWCTGFGVHGGSGSHRRVNTGSRLFCSRHIHHVW